jgi:histidinol-phosphate phosphatase family protein
VPLPADRRPTDWERHVTGLERARWATADMAYRRAVLAFVRGFDERFPRAYREDADLALRVRAAGYRLDVGGRRVTHPVRVAGPWVSVRMQAGNADDALMRALHGRAWRRRAGISRGRRPTHLAISAALGIAVATAFAGRRALAATAALAWLAGTAEFAWRRLAPGPRTPRETAIMLLTSTAIPVAASYHWLRGVMALPRLLAADVGREGRAPRAVLLDRDGTLVVDLPYNGDPARVVPVAGVRAALERLRRAGIALAVVSNQSGVGRGLVTRAQVDAVNRRIEALLGPLGPWLVCEHTPDDRCLCRKPEPGLVRRATAALGVAPADCVVIGDTGDDVEAARRAGARAILVPNPVTRREEIEAAPETAPSFAAAVARVLATTPARAAS